ncbi:hypothetical protein I4F81_012203 [Pyropia yezoensis]|uniref:Uncharacterized protein n=1 Tax=Pyropia yezoensis TaxID=2788 RepID=A0ACC3CHT0_PYRYE|nr:hypothetical protein I4F81_012203 [Neopyropia yezoensis]
MSTTALGPADAFSFLLRLCFEWRPIDKVKGSNVPILMILHVVMQLRALAGIIYAKDTDAFADYFANAFGTASVQGVNTLLHKSLKVTADEVDVKDGVAFAKHIQNQSAELNALLAGTALNPAAAKWSWLCRNLRLRSVAVVAVIPSAPDAPTLDLTMAEMSSVSATLHTLAESSPPSLPQFCSFPFLLDDSWRSPGLCLSYCRKVLCDPDPRNMGWTYETIFSMNKEDIERERQAVAGGGRAQQYPPVPGTLPRPPGSPTPTTPTAQPTPPTPSSITDGAAPTPAASTGPAASAATGSVPPEQPTGDRAANEYEGLQEEELELGLLPDLGLGATPTSVFMGMLGASTPAAGTAGAPRGGAPTVDTTSGVPSRVAPPPGPPSAGAPLIPVRPDGSAGNPSSVADRDAPVTSPVTAGRDSAAVVVAAVSAFAAGQPPPDSPSRLTAQQPPTPGRPPRQRESTLVTADAFEAELASVTASKGLHDGFLKALHVCNADMGFDLSETIKIKEVAGSPKASFSMRCTFLSAMDLDTSRVTTNTVRTEQFIVAAYQARAGLPSAPINVCD